MTYEKRCSDPLFHARISQIFLKNDVLSTLKLCYAGHLTLETGTKIAIKRIYSAHCGKISTFPQKS